MRRIKSAGFTLAEVLIVLGLIGIVAESTIPTLISNVTKTVFAQSSSLTLMKVQEATAQMKVDGVLDGYTSTDSFVDTFQKYMRINKRCDSSNLTDCVTEKFKTSTGLEVLTSTLTTGTTLEAKNLTGNTVGLMLANGTSLLLSLRDSTKVGTACDRIDPVDNPTSTIACLSGFYDTNGASGPNMVGKDITMLNTKYNSTLVGNLYVADSNAAYVTIDTCVATATPENRAYDPSANVQCSNNAWAGAKKQCASIGMTLPDEAQAAIMYANRASIANYGASDNYWTSAEHPTLTNQAKYLSNSGFIGSTGKIVASMKARCVK